VPSADIGLPQLAMHSCYETVSARDTLAMADVLGVYYSATLEVPSDGSYILK